MPAPSVSVLSARAPEAEPNVTPFIDVLLVLLVIFMLAQTVRQTTPLTTPPAEGAPGPEARPQIVLELRGDGSFAINRQPVPATELRAQFQAIYASRAAKLLFVDAAPSRTYQEVITAIGIARDAGVEVVAMMPAAGAP